MRRNAEGRRPRPPHFRPRRVDTRLGEDCFYDARTRRLAAPGRRRAAPVSPGRAEPCGRPPRRHTDGGAGPAPPPTPRFGARVAADLAPREALGELLQGA